MPPAKKIALLAPNALNSNPTQTDELETGSERSSGEDGSDTSHGTSDLEDIDEANESDRGIQTKLLTPPLTLAKKRKCSGKDGEHHTSELRSHWQLKRPRF